MNWFPAWLSGRRRRVSCNPWDLFLFEETGGDAGVSDRLTAPGTSGPPLARPQPEADSAAAVQREDVDDGSLFIGSCV